MNSSQYRLKGLRRHGLKPVRLKNGFSLSTAVTLAVTSVSSDIRGLMVCYGFTVGQWAKITVIVLFKQVADWLQQALNFTLVFLYRVRVF